MSCNLLVSNNSSVQTVLIPYRSTVEQMAEYFVFVVNADSVAQRKVSLGQRIRDMVVVNSGLQPNEIIVLDGIQKLKDGSKIKVTSSDSLKRVSADSLKRKS
jgi:membrane fusion protein (multidrug efflux system)